MSVRSSARWTYRGERVRGEILEAATRMALADGLHRVTLGRLAKAAGVSKSGLFEHFGSIEELHAAIVTDAVWRFEQSVLTPARQVMTGMPALYTLLHRWLVHVTSRREVCATQFEVGPGRGRDVLASCCSTSMSALRWEISMARAQEQFQPCEEDRLAFELHAPIAEAAWLERYLKSENGRSLGSEMIDSVLNRVVTASGAESLAIVRVAEAKWLEGRELALDDF